MRTVIVGSFAVPGMRHFNQKFRSSSSRTTASSSSSRHASASTTWQRRSRCRTAAGSMGRSSSPARFHGPPDGTGDYCRRGMVLQRYHRWYRGGTAISRCFRTWRITEIPGHGPGRYCELRCFSVSSGSEPLTACSAWPAQFEPAFLYRGPARASRDRFKS